MDHGQEEDHLAIYRHGRDQDGYSVEEHAGGYSEDHGDSTGIHRIIDRLHGIHHITLIHGSPIHTHITHIHITHTKGVE